MAENNKHIDDLFKESLGNYSELPDASVWSDIELKLDTMPAPGPSGSSAGGAAGSSAIIGTGKILLLLITGAALFFTARWAIGNFNQNNAKPVAVEIRPGPAHEPLMNRPEIPTENNVANTPSVAVADSDVKTKIVKEPAPNKLESLPKNQTANDADRDEKLLSKKIAEAKTQNAIAKPVATPDAVALSPAAKAASAKPNVQPKEPASTTAPAGREPEAKSSREDKTPDTEATLSRSSNKTVAITPAAKPVSVVPAPIVPEVKLPAKDNVAIAKEEVIKPVVPPTEPPAPVKPRVKEEIEALFFNGSAVLLGSGVKPDVDYGMLNTDNGLERVTKMLKRRLEAGAVEAGIKAALETGLQKYRANKFVLMPYLQYSVSGRVSVLLQPGFKFGRHNLTEGPKLSYYNITNSSVTSNHSIKSSIDTLQPDTITRRYVYRQTYDSLTLGLAPESKGYFEFELPILLQYGINKKLSVYGGLTFNFAKTIRMKEDRREYKNLTRTNTVEYAPVSVTEEGPVPPSIDSMFVYNTNPYTGNAIPAQNPTSDPLKVGYMVGVNYRIGKRFMADIMVQQMLNNGGYIPNKDVRAVHKQPYIRVGIGYRLFKSGK